MNIIVLDGETTNPGDISWAPLERLGNLLVYPHTKEADILERAKEFEAVIINRAPFTRTTIEALPKLQYIGALATGYNTIDTQAAAERGIPVCNVPLYCVETVAQCTFSLLLALCSHTETFSHTVKTTGWGEALKASHTTLPLVELSGKKMGILGYGNIGAAVGKMAEAFGMEVLVYSRSKKELPPSHRQCELEALFRDSDVVSIHCPLTEDTKGLVDKALLSLMKPSALLINTARGAIVDEEALAQALSDGILAGAGIDVFSQEPPPPSHPLLHAPHCIVTPHIAWASKEARQRLIDQVAENLAQFQKGKPIHVVN